MEQSRGLLEVWKSDKVGAEDVREDIASLLPGIEFLTRITISGDPPKAFFAKSWTLARKLAVECHGVLFDPQTGNLLTPTGVKRFLPTKREETFSITSLSWWSLDQAVCEPTGIERFVATIERLLPEGLPRRYGLWEPPQHVYAKNGRDSFVDFLKEHIHEVIVWYPSRPVLSVSLERPNSTGPTRLGFRTCRLNVDIETSAFEQPGWETHVRRVWHELSELMRPFYGDVRVLAGYSKVGGGLAVGPGAEQHPVKSWWWRGIPSSTPNAMVLGPIYQRLWPSFTA